MKARVMEINLHKIHPNLRSVYDIRDIDGLYTSIRSQGQREPIQIWFDGGRFRILDGEKRWRACKRLGMSRIKAMIVQADPAAPISTAL